MSTRVCANPDCDQAGIPQPTENFHNGKYRCKKCVRVDNKGRQIRWRARVAASTAPVDREPNMELPVQPWRDWLERQVQIMGSQEVARMLCIPDRVLYRWRYENKHVRLDALDKALCNFKHPELLRELYPELYRKCRVCKRTGVHTENCPFRSSSRAQAKAAEMAA